jgi:Antidote-toxin recognition MazE, bacterial antitoxin
MHSVVEPLPAIYTIRDTNSEPNNLIQVAKWGNGQAVRLPKRLYDSHGVTPGDGIEIVDAGRDKGYCKSKEPSLGFITFAAAKLWPPLVRVALGQAVLTISSLFS